MQPNISPDFAEVKATLDAWDAKQVRIAPAAVIGPLSAAEMDELSETLNGALNDRASFTLRRRADVPPVTWEVRARILRPLDGVVGVTVDVECPSGIRTTSAGGATEVEVADGRGDVLAQQMEAVAAGMMRDLEPAARDQFARIVRALARGVERSGFRVEGDCRD